MTQWEQLEQWIISNGLVNGDFVSWQVAHDLGISGRDASSVIQNYLEAQTRPVSPTAFVLTRSGRTSGTVWHVGFKTDDARALCKQEADDARWRFERFTRPSLLKIVGLNPRAAVVVQTLELAFEYNLGQLEFMLNNQSAPPTPAPTP
jgi:hypothetical protein